MVHNMGDIENVRDIDHILTILKSLNKDELTRVREFVDKLPEREKK